MFCPNCGFECTQKTNYCKRCGGALSSSDKEPMAQLPGLKITGVFFVIAALVLFGMMQIYSVYMKMLYAGVRGAELFVPLLLGFALLGAVALLLARLLSWAIAGARHQMDRAAANTLQGRWPGFIKVRRRMSSFIKLLEFFTE